MKHSCKCGGRLLRSDIVPVKDEKTGLTMYKDTDTLIAHFKCNKCGDEKTQRKRQPKRTQLPPQFWAVVWQNELVGPFTDLEAGRTWAADRGCTQMLKIYAPLVDEPNKGHTIGRFLTREEM